jgi:hypothetical protein
MLISKESDMRANKQLFFSMSTLKSCYIVDRYILMIPLVETLNKPVETKQSKNPHK